MSTLSITLIQSQIHWEDKVANLAMFEKKVKSIEETAELVILPEMFSTGFSMRAEALAEKMDGPTVTWMKNLAASRNIILTGSLIIEEGGKYYNRLVWVLPNGQTGQYDKRHLFAYGGENQYYSAGSRRLIASVKGWKLNLLVCYDLRFPVWCRQSEKQEGAEFDLLVFVANWPERRIGAWKTLLQARAIENQCYVAGVNRIGEDGSGIRYSGDSMIIDPLGEILYQKSGEEDIFTAVLQKERLQEVRNKYPFLRDADDFFISA
jgi:omega-amidase